MTTVAQAGCCPAVTTRAAMGLGATTFLRPGAAFIMRAITIDVPADQVWPWLAPLGYRRAS